MPVQTRSQTRQVPPAMPSPPMQLPPAMQLPMPMPVPEATNTFTTNVLYKSSDPVFDTVGKLFVPGTQTDNWDNLKFFIHRVKFLLSGVSNIDDEMSTMINNPASYTGTDLEDTLTPACELQRRTLRYDKLRLVAELFFFITIYYPKAHPLIRGKNGLLPTIIKKIGEIKRDMVAPYNVPTDETERIAYDALHTSTIMCEQALYKFHVCT